MKIWKALIVDDESLARLELKRLLQEHSQIHLAGEAASVPEAVEAIQALAPDLLFLDIDLGTHSGFDLLEKVARNFRLVFVTAYDEYALRAFKVNALDYLLKPIHPDRLRESVNRLGNTVSQEVLYHLEPFDKILVSRQQSSRLITVSSISYVEACGDYTCIHTSDGFRGTVHHTIKRWVERLPSKMFMQCHRSYIVNLDHIQHLNKRSKDSFEIVLNRSGLTIPMGRGFSRKLLDTFKPR